MADFEKPAREEFDRLDSLRGQPIDYSDIPEIDFSSVKRHRGLPSFLRNRDALSPSEEKRRDPVEAR
jgi:hypothetical protein